MKLAILGTRGIPSRYGGFETFTEEIATRLASTGIDVTVFCPTDSPKDDDDYRGVKLVYVKVPKYGPFEQILWDAKCLYLAKNGFDVVYVLGTGGSFAAWIPRLSGSQVWMNTDGIEWLRAKWNFWGRAYLMVSEALAVLFSNRIIADSHAIADYLRKRYVWTPDISTIAYGAYPVYKEPTPEPLSEWNLLPGGYDIVVCRLEPENHVLEIIEGVERSKSMRPLVILGDVKNPNQYVKELLIHQSARVRFLGTVYDREKLVALRYHAHCYIHGHSVGGTNPSLLEAMACSSLIVAHDNPFNREVLDGSGLFFKNRNDLAAVLDAIEAGDGDLESLRTAARDRICLKYRWEQIADAYQELLQVRRYESNG